MDLFVLKKPKYDHFLKIGLQTTLTGFHFDVKNKDHVVVKFLYLNEFKNLTNLFTSLKTRVIITADVLEHNAKNLAKISLLLLKASLHQIIK